MSMKKKSNPVKLSERPTSVDVDEKPDKRDPGPNDQRKETGPPIGEMSIKNHPHLEEILD